MTIQKSIILSFKFADISCVTSPLPPENLCQHMSDFKIPPPPSTADIICERSLIFITLAKNLSPILKNELRNLKSSRKMGCTLLYKSFSHQMIYGNFSDPTRKMGKLEALSDVYPSLH